MQWAQWNSGRGLLNQPWPVIPATGVQTCHAREIGQCVIHPRFHIEANDWCTLPLLIHEFLEGSSMLMPVKSCSFLGRLPRTVLQARSPRWPVIGRSVDQPTGPGVTRLFHGLLAYPCRQANCLPAGLYKGTVSDRLDCVAAYEPWVCVTNDMARKINEKHNSMYYSN